MTYYAIKNKKDGRLVAGTDYTRNGPPRQILADENRAPKLFGSRTTAEIEMQVRRMSGARYKVVAVEVREV